MQVNNRWNISLVSMLCLSCCTQLLAQVPNPQINEPSVEYRPIPSNMALMNDLKLPHPGIVASVDTQTIDLSQTITRFAELKKISTEEARIETLIFLGMQPKTKLNYSPGDNPNFKHVENDRYEISANNSFFEILPSMLRSLELGKKQVLVSCYIVRIDPNKSKRINAFLEPGSVAVNCSKIPDVAPVATAAGSESDATSFVSTSTTITKNTPVTTGLITRAKFKKLVAYLKETNADIAMSPKIVMFPGQVGTISDAAQRPFVVGLEAIHGPDEHVAMQPVVQALEDGVTVRVKAIPYGEKLQLMGDLAISEVTNVEKFTFASSGEKTQQSFQIPHHTLRQVHLSSLLDADTAILIDPNFVQVTESTGPHGKISKHPRKTVFILQTRMMDMPNSTPTRR